MNSLNKKLLLGIVIVVLLIIAGGIGGVIIIYNQQKPRLPMDISAAAVKAKCLEDVSKMTDEELMTEVKNLKYPEEIMPSTGEERIIYGSGQMIGYLICRLSSNKNENLYNRAKSFIEGLAIEEENKQNSLASLDANYLEVDFMTMLALGDLSQICPAQLPNFCLKELIRSNIDDEWMIEHCKDMCNFINQCCESRDKLEENIVQEPWFDDVLSREMQYGSRAAIIYRCQGPDLAFKICDNVNASEKENCISSVKNHIESLDKCNILHNNLESLICDIPHE